ncbi:MAG: glycoside hydrolase family 10, partial [Micrococcaceae bacterium]|nr:glycoside hydrolase family 10 [Micrococcaceae bacterium]
MARRPHMLMVALACGLLVVLGGCSPPQPTPEHDETVDMLHQDWQHVPGVSSVGGGLKITATAGRIVQQDGTGGQPNPPVNVAGTHLVVGGDFTLSATLANV